VTGVNEDEQIVGTRTVGGGSSMARSINGDMTDLGSK
jgi:hypothetical protein